MFLHIGGARYIPVGDILILLDADTLRESEQRKNAARKSEPRYNRHYKTVILTERASHLSPIACGTLKKRLEQTTALFRTGEIIVTE